MRAQKEILAARLCDGVPAVCGLRAPGPPAWLETREWARWQKGAQCARPQERLSQRGGYRALGTVADPRARGGGVSTLGQGAGGAVHGEGSPGASVRPALTAGAQGTTQQGPRLQGGLRGVGAREDVRAGRRAGRSQACVRGAGVVPYVPASHAPFTRSWKGGAWGPREVWGEGESRRVLMDGSLVEKERPVLSSRLRQRSLSRPRLARSPAARIRSRVLRLVVPPSGREIRRGALIEEGGAIPLRRPSPPRNCPKTEFLLVARTNTQEEHVFA